MSFFNYNLNNIGAQLATLGPIFTPVTPVYGDKENNSENSDTTYVTALSQDDVIKRVVSRSLPPSPKKQKSLSRRTNSISSIPITSIAHSSTRKVRFAETAPHTVQRAIKGILKNSAPLPQAEELPKWWMPALTTLLESAEANIGHNPNFDRALMYEYIRKIDLPQARTNYQARLETFLPKTLKHLLSIIHDQQFIQEVKQVNLWTTDAGIQAVEASILSARTAVLRKLFQ